MTAQIVTKDSKSRGFGFVVFEQLDDLLEVLVLQLDNDFKLNGKRIHCKREWPKQINASEDGHGDDRRIYDGRRNSRDSRDGYSRDSRRYERHNESYYRDSHRKRHEPYKSVFDIPLHSTSNSGRIEKAPSHRDYRDESVAIDLSKR